MVAPRCLLVVASVHHGNTARVAAAIADVLGAEVAGSEDVSPGRIGGYDVVGFGSGVYYGGMHESLFDVVRGLPDAGTAGVAIAADVAGAATVARPAFVFSTSGLPCLAKVWHAPLERLLAEKGFDVVGAFACRGFDTWGPLWLTGGLNRKHPDDRDLARARKFARWIAAAVPASKRAG
ncbi:MAG: flavodoxin family protein [Planctomycetaceae bacterium]